MSTAPIHDSPAPQVLAQNTTVSVVIPAFNAAAYLGEALESTLGQTYQPIEVIVVDDGSEDETPQVAAAYAGKVTYLRKQRGGPASARNAGIRVASGEWIAFLDADDVWMPNLLEKLVKGAEETGADLAFCDGLTLKNGRIVGPTFFERAGLKARMGTFALNGLLLNPLLLFLEFHQFMLTCALLVRRDALLQVGLFDEHIYCGEDLDLWLRLSLRYRLGVVNENLVLRRIHAHNLTRDPWTLRTGLIQVYEKLERNASTLAAGTEWRKVLRKKKAPLLREQGAVYLVRGEFLLARESWAKCFRASHSPIVAAYWLLSFLPQSWVEALWEWKRQIKPVPPSPGYTG